MDGNWNDMKYIEIAPLNDSTDCSYLPDLPDVPSVDYEPVHVKVCVLFFSVIFFAQNYSVIKNITF